MIQGFGELEQIKNHLPPFYLTHEQAKVNLRTSEVAAQLDFESRLDLWESRRAAMTQACGRRLS